MTDIRPYARDDAGSPPSLFADYRSTILRAPRQPHIRIPTTLTETTGPAGCWDRLIGPPVADLTTQHVGRTGAEPIGQRIIVAGRVLDDGGRPVLSDNYGRSCNCRGGVGMCERRSRAVAGVIVAGDNYPSDNYDGRSQARSGWPF